MEQAAQSRTWRFSVLLAALLLFLVLNPLLFDDNETGLVYDLLFALVLLMATLSLSQERHTRKAALILGLPIVALLLFGHAVPESVRKPLVIAGHIAGIFFLLGTVVLIIETIFREQRIDLDGICGAVCGYLLLGLAWGVAYGLLAELDPGSFRVHPDHEVELADWGQRGSLLVYYSFVTLTTLGYGDVSPATPATRTLSWLEAMTGQFYLAILVAGLVSTLVSRRASK